MSTRTWNSKLALFSGVFIYLLVISLLKPIGNDEGVWFYLAYLWKDWGLPPFTWGPDTKPPAIYELFTLSYWLFGPNPYPLRFLGVLCLTLSAYFVYQLGKEFFGERAGLLAALIFGLSSGWRQVDGPFTAETEVFASSLVLGAAYLLARRRGSFLPGLLGGLAASFKPVFALSFLGALALLGENPKRAAASLLWAAVSFLFTFVPVFLSGETPWHYAREALQVLLHYSPDLHRRVSGFLNSWFRSPFLAFWLGLVGFWLKARDKRLALWMALDFLGANLSGFYWGHQLRQVLPSTSLAAGAGLAGLGLPLWSGLIWGLAAETGFSRKPEVREVAQVVQSLSEPSEPVLLLAHGRVEVLGLLRRRSPSPIFNGGLLKLPGALGKLREDVRKNPPKLVIVDEKFQRKGWAQELLREYRVVRSWKGYTLYILSKSPSATRLRLGRSETLRSP